MNAVGSSRRVSAGDDRACGEWAGGEETTGAVACQQRDTHLLGRGEPRAPGEKLVVQSEEPAHAGAGLGSLLHSREGTGERPRSAGRSHRRRDRGAGERRGTAEKGVYTARTKNSC